MSKPNICRASDHCKMTSNALEATGVVESELGEGYFPQRSFKPRRELKETFTGRQMCLVILREGPAGKTAPKKDRIPALAQYAGASVA